VEIIILFFAGMFLAWHHLAFVCASPGLVVIISMIFLPESPSHLISKGREDAATNALCMLQNLSGEDARLE